MAREVFLEAATLLHNGLVLDGLDEHDASAVVAGLCVDLIAPDPGPAVRARAQATLDDPGDLHDPDGVSAAFLTAASDVPASERPAPENVVQTDALWWRLRGDLFGPAEVIARPPWAAPRQFTATAGLSCCLGASARSPIPSQAETKVEEVVVATLPAATAHLISMLIRPLVLVARMRVHVRMDPESAYHGLLGHEGRYVLRPPVSRVECPSPATP